MEKRILKELSQLQKQPNPSLELKVLNDSLSELQARITGPKDTPYANGQFYLSLKLPAEYPHKPPKITFETRICHPNVSFETGEICLDLLSSQWSPLWTITSTLEAIRMMLGQPEPLSPLNVDCAKLLRIGDQKGYESLCRMYTVEYASVVE